MEEAAPVEALIRRSTMIIVGTIVVATFLIILTMKDSTPEARCAFLNKKVSEPFGRATEADLEEFDRLGC